jgi:hypothetical protein
MRLSDSRGCARVTTALVHFSEPIACTDECVGNVSLLIARESERAKEKVKIFDTFTALPRQPHPHAFVTLSGRV